MDAILSTRADDTGAGLVHHGRSAASWGAIVAGAFVAASISLFLLTLGAGLGFASVSPWTGHVSAATFAMTTVIWLIVMQWISAGLGGYIAGRLRTRWTGTHTHEVFFRDTAHGLVTWALATVVVAGVLASPLISGGVHLADSVTGGEVDTTAASGASYNIDKLFRTSADSFTGVRNYRGEAAHIVANAVSNGALPPADRMYLGTLIAHEAGVSQEEAQKRVDDAAATAKAAAEAARTTAAKAAIFTALSMLIGAFIASVSAALGGRLRDEHP